MHSYSQILSRFNYSWFIKDFLTLPIAILNFRLTSIDRICFFIIHCIFNRGVQRLRLPHSIRIFLSIFKELLRSINPLTLISCSSVYLWNASTFTFKMFGFLSFRLSTCLIQFSMLQIRSCVIVISTLSLPLSLLEKVLAAIFLSLSIQVVLLAIFDWWSTYCIWNMTQNISALHSVAVALLWCRFLAIETLLHHAYIFELILQHCYPLLISFLHFDQVFLQI